MYYKSMARHGILHGTAFPSQAEQSNVFILLNIWFSRNTEWQNKKPSIYQVTKKGFYNQNQKTFLFLLYCTVSSICKVDFLFIILCIFIL